MAVTAVGSDLGSAYQIT